MPKISRRAALARGGRALTAAAILPLAGVSVEAHAAEGDAELLGAIKRFKRLAKRYLKAWGEARAAYDQAENHPDFPPDSFEQAAQFDAEGVKYDYAEMCRDYCAKADKLRGQFGYYAKYDRATPLEKQARKAVKPVFALPARTLKGALAKLQLANWLRKQFEEPDDWADHGEWELAAQRDFERLLQRAA